MNAGMIDLELNGKVHGWWFRENMRRIDEIPPLQPLFCLKLSDNTFTSAS